MNDSLIQPCEIYGNSSRIGIKVASVGAGTTGLLRKLSESYLKKSPHIQGKSFSIAWYKSNTTRSLEYLKKNWIDIAFTYEESLEMRAIQGQFPFASARAPIFVDHFYLVGPESNPAKISNQRRSGLDSLIVAFQKIKEKSYSKLRCPEGSYYLTRNERSATHMKERSTWLKVINDYSALLKEEWVIKFNQLPTEALQEANLKQAYFLVDRGTWIVFPAQRSRLRVWVDGTDDHHNPHLLNPCHALLAKKQHLESPQTEAFFHWLQENEAQTIISNFGQEQWGEPLFKASGSFRAL